MNINRVVSHWHGIHSSSIHGEQQPAGASTADNGEEDDGAFNDYHSYYYYCVGGMCLKCSRYRKYSANAIYEQLIVAICEQHSLPSQGIDSQSRLCH